MGVHITASAVRQHTTPASKPSSKNQSVQKSANVITFMHLKYTIMHVYRWLLKILNWTFHLLGQYHTQKQCIFQHFLTHETLGVCKYMGAYTSNTQDAHYSSLKIWNFFLYPHRELLVYKGKYSLKMAMIKQPSKAI